MFEQLLAGISLYLLRNVIQPKPGEKGDAFMITNFMDRFTFIIISDFHEVELMCVDCHEEGVQQWDKCRKNPTHPHFHTYKDLLVRDLPAEWRCEDNFKFVKDIGKRTVRLRTNCTSFERPDHDPFASVRGTEATRMGTGNVYEDQIEIVECMFEDCPIEPKPHKVLTFNVSTAKHVIYNDEEAEETNADFFFECQGPQHGCENHAECKKRMVAAWGIEVLWTDKRKDASLLKCASHDLSLLDKIKSENLLLDHCGIGKEISFIVSHPHGCCKQVTFGKVHRLMGMDSEEAVVQSDDKVWFRRSFTKALYDIDTCPGTSGAAVFSFNHGPYTDSITHALHNKCCQTEDDESENSQQYNGSNVGHLHTREHHTKILSNRAVLSLWKAEFYKKFGEFLGELFTGRSQ